MDCRCLTQVEGGVIETRKKIFDKPWRRVHDGYSAEVRLNFVTMMCERHQGDDQWLKLWMFTDEATFHVSGRANTPNCLIWETENPRVSYKLERASPEQNVWCGVTSEKVYGPFFFEEETVRAVNYLDMINYSKMGYWTPLSINRMALTALGYHSEGTIKPHIERSLVWPWWAYPLAP